MKRTLATMWIALVTLGAVRQLAAQGTAFTYQGRLADSGSPANGRYEFQFTVYDVATNGAAQGGPLASAGTAVSNGLFTVVLDFGAMPFTGADRWLEIGVRTNGSVGAFTVLTPRQLLTATPYAVRAANFSGAVSDAQLSANVARLDGSNWFSGAVQFNNTDNAFTGTFAGSGLGVSNTLNGDLWHLNRGIWAGALAQLSGGPEAGQPLQIMMHGESGHAAGIYLNLIADYWSIAPVGGVIGQLANYAVWQYTAPAAATNNNDWYIQHGLLAAGGAITETNSAGPQFRVNVVGVDYLQQPGAGTFRADVSFDGVTWSSIGFGGLTNIDANGPPLGVPLRWTNSVARPTQVRVVGMTGAEQILSLDLINDSEWGVVANSHMQPGSLHWAGFFGGTLDITNVVAPIWESWGPNLLLYYELVQQTNWPYYLPKYYAWLKDVAHLTDTTLVVLNNQPDLGASGPAGSFPDFNTNLLSSSIELRDCILTNNYPIGYFDLYHALGGLTNALVNGLVPPTFDARPTPKGARVAAQALFEWLGLHNSGDWVGATHRGASYFANRVDVSGGLYVRGPVWSYSSTDAALSVGGRNNNFNDRWEFVGYGGSSAAFLLQYANNGAPLLAWSNVAGINSWNFQGSQLRGTEIGSVGSSGLLTNNGVVWYCTNNTPTADLPNGSIATVNDGTGRLFLRTGGVWVEK